MCLDGLMGFCYFFLTKPCFYLLVSLSICNLHQQAIGANESLWIWIGDCVKDTGHDGIKLFNNSPTACFQYCGESATRIGLQGENCNCKVVINSIQLKSECMAQCPGSDMAKCGNPAKGTWSVFQRANINDIKDKNFPLNSTGCATVRFPANAEGVSYHLNNCTGNHDGSICRRVRQHGSRCDGQTSSWMTACKDYFERLVSNFGDIEQARNDDYCSPLQEYWIGLFALKMNVIELASSTIEASFSTAWSQITESPDMSTAVQQANESTLTEVISSSSYMTFETSDYELSTSYPSISSVLEYSSFTEPLYSSPFTNFGSGSSLIKNVFDASTPTSSITTFTPQVSPSQLTKGFDASTSTSSVTTFTLPVSPSQLTKGFDVSTSTSSITTFTPQISPSQLTKGFDVSTSTSSITTFTPQVSPSQLTKGFDASTSTSSITTFTPLVSPSQLTKGFDASTPTSSIIPFTPQVSPSQLTKGFDASTPTSSITTFTPQVSPSQLTKGFDASTPASSITPFTPQVSPSHLTKGFDVYTPASSITPFTPQVSPSQLTKGLDASTSSSLTSAFSSKVISTQMSSQSSVSMNPTHLITTTAYTNTIVTIPTPHTDEHSILSTQVKTTDVHTTTTPPITTEKDVQTTTTSPTTTETEDVHTTTSSPSTTEKEDVQTTTTPPTTTETEDVHTTTSPPTITETEDVHTTTSSPTTTETEDVHTTISPSTIAEIKALKDAVIGVGVVAFLAVIAVCVLFIHMKRTIGNMKKEMQRVALQIEPRDSYRRRRSHFARRDDAAECVSSTRHGNGRQPNIMFSGSRRANLRSNYTMSSLEHGTRVHALDNDYIWY